MVDAMNDAALRHAQNLRRRSLVLPREHGAWGILLIPLLSGAAVGLSQTPRPGPVLLLAAAAVILFWLRTPVESLLGAGPMRACGPAERLFVLTWIALLAAAAGMLLAALLWRGQHILLLPLGAVAGLAFLAQAAVRRFSPAPPMRPRETVATRRRQTRTLAQVIGAFGLTSTAAAALYVVTGQIDHRALALWGANWLFAALQIQFVQLRIQGAKLSRWVERVQAGAGFFAAELLLAALLLFAWAWRAMPALALIAFLPLFLRGIAWFFRRPQPLRLRRLGFTELAHGVAFGVLLSLAFVL